MSFDFSAAESALGIARKHLAGSKKATLGRVAWGYHRLNEELTNEVFSVAKTLQDARDFTKRAERFPKSRDNNLRRAATALAVADEQSATNEAYPRVRGFTTEAIKVALEGPDLPSADYGVSPTYFYAQEYLGRVLTAEGFGDLTQVRFFVKYHAEYRNLVSARAKHQNAGNARFADHLATFINARCDELLSPSYGSFAAKCGMRRALVSA